jgi:predicted transcriptional regulator
MSPKAPTELSRRERQILDLLHRLGRATAAEVQEALPDPPSYSAVRTHLRILEEKGHVRHEQDGPRYVFRPTASLQSARKRALAHLLSTFFGGSVEEAVAALIGTKEGKLSAAEVTRLRKLIDESKRERGESEG